MIKSILKFWVPWVIGVIAAVSAMSLWQKEELDWGHIVTMSIAGLIGIFIATGIKKDRTDKTY